MRFEEKRHFGAYKVKCRFFAQDSCVLRKAPFWRFLFLLDTRTRCIKKVRNTKQRSPTMKTIFQSEVLTDESFEFVQDNEDIVLELQKLAIVPEFKA